MGYAVEIELPEDDETPENVRPGYCGAYASHFEACGLSFPLPRFLLEVLAEIKMAFTQITPNFFRQLFAIKRNNGFPGTMILAPRGGRGIIEGIRNKDDRWREKFFVFKINSASVGDFDFERIPREWSDDIGSTRWLSFTPDQIRAACALPPGANRATHVALVAPVRPKRGRGTKRKKEKEVLLDRPDESSEAGSLERARKVQRGEFLLSIEPFGSAPMSPELRGLMETLRRGSTRWLSFTPDRIRAACALPPSANRATPVALVAPVRPKRGRGTKRKKEKEGLLDRPDESSEAGPVSVAIPSGGAREAPDTSASSAGDRALNDEIDSSSHRSRRRVLEEINSVTSGSSSPRLSPPLRASGEGTSRANPGVLPSSVPEAFSWSFAYDSEIPILENPNSLAAIWCKVRAEGCELPSLEHIRERDAYVRMAVANAKAMEASNDYAALMEGRLANFSSKEEIAGHLLTIQQLREMVVVQSDLDSMKEKYRREIEGRDRKARKDLHLARVSLAKEYEGVLDVVKARIEALTEYSEGGFELEAKLERPKDLEVSLDVDYGLASVSDPSLGRLNLPEISGDSVIQD
ncbi:hypothetical protein DY000_02024750 [Brassica cretica]|uniref:Uncharacterized protein n=1 Tax=Brassica cretica TaxID=69181 RepID=A0ABQ7E249_BRACR|nr:hypothetical protein DY000_02024750 [Brassica cretica]